MGSSKRVTVGYRYFMGLHFGICYGPVDSIRRLIVGDRDAFSGNITSNSTVPINEPNLFGGDQREGGIVGDLQVLMGGPTQTLTGKILSALGAGAPAFRRVLSLFYDGQIGSNNPYVKPFAFKITRILQGWQGGTAWYPEKASIGSAGGTLLGYTGAWEYQVLPEEANPGFDGITIPTTGYSAAAAGPFGAGLASAQTPPGNNLWPLRTVLWVRRTVMLAENVTAQLEVTAENGCIVFANGVLIGAVNRENIDFTTSFPPTQYLTIPRASPGTSETVTIVIKAFDETSVENGTTTYLRTAMSVSGMFPAMNPAHILYQCQTDPDWGMGYPPAIIGDSFTAAADTFFAEGLGLCMLWNQQDEIGNFVGMVLDHCGANLAEDPATGKLELKLLRGGYDPASLPVFDPGTIIDLESWQRVGYGDTVNEITVVYRDVATGKDASITVQDLANIQAQGGVVSETRQYPGIPLATLAARIAQRDLIAASTPLAKGRISVNRNAWSLVSGDLLRLTWPKLGLSNVICRVLAVDYGDLRNAAITVDVAEDVFGLPASSYAAQQPAGWLPPTTAPTIIALQAVVEVPYWTLARELTAADLSFVDADAAYLAPIAARPASTAQQYRIWSRVGSAAYEDQNTGEFVPAAMLSLAIDQAEIELPLAGAVDLEQVAIGDLAIIGTGRAAEWVEITAIDVGVPSITVNRGMLDTTPAMHAIGEPVFFTDTANSKDETERATGESVDFKLATIATGGELDYTLATTVTGTAAQRQYRPYPPSNVLIDGAPFPSVVTAAFTVAWAHRDRVQQTAYLVEQTEASIGPEAGTTYNAFAYDDSTGTLLVTLTGITGTSWAPSISGSYRLRVELEAQRDGVTSWQRQVRVFEYVDKARRTESDDLRYTEADAPRSLE